GESLIAERETTAKGRRSATDPLLMRRIQAAVDRDIAGAGTLRPGNLVYDPRLWRAVITRSGDLPLENRFFTDAPEKAIVFAPESLPNVARARLSRFNLRLVGAESVDLPAAMAILRNEFNVRNLALEGGATTNFDFISQRL